MRVVTKLAKMDFRVGTINVEGREIVLESHPDQPLKVKAYVGPDDLADLLKAGLSREVLAYLVKLPVLLMHGRKAERGRTAAEAASTEAHARPQRIPTGGHTDER